jgi:hypothetical protein
MFCLYPQNPTIKYWIPVLFIYGSPIILSDYAVINKAACGCNERSSTTTTDPVVTFVRIVRSNHRIKQCKPQNHPNIMTNQANDCRNRAQRIDEPSFWDHIIVILYCGFLQTMARFHNFSILEFTVIILIYKLFNVLGWRRSPPSPRFPTWSQPRRCLLRRRMTRPVSIPLFDFG